MEEENHLFFDIQIKKKRYLTRQTSYFNFYFKNGRNFNVYRKWREQSCFTPTPLCDYCLISSFTVWHVIWQ